MKFIVFLAQDSTFLKTVLHKLYLSDYLLYLFPVLMNEAQRLLLKCQYNLILSQFIPFDSYPTFRVTGQRLLSNLVGADLPQK